MSAARKLGALVLLTLAVGAGAYLLAGTGPQMPAEPLAAVPDDAVAVLWVDVPAVRRSALWERLVVARGGDRGLRRVQRLCGVDPLGGLTEIVAFADSEGPDDLMSGLGFIGRGTFDHEGLADCVRTVVEEDGGELRRIEIDGVPAVAGRGSSRAAFVGRDAVVGGNDDVVRAVLGVVHGHEPSAASDETLSRLFALVRPQRDVVLAAHVPVAWRNALRSRLRDAVDREIIAVGGVRAIGIGLSLHLGFGARVVLQMQSPEQAEQARDALRQQIDDLLSDPALALSALGPVLRRVELDADTDLVVLRADLTVDHLLGAVELVETLLSEPRRPDDRRGDPPPRGQRAPDEPDEVVQRDAGAARRGPGR